MKDTIQYVTICFCYWLEDINGLLIFIGRLAKLFNPCEVTFGKREHINLIVLNGNTYLLFKKGKMQFLYHIYISKLTSAKHKK